MNTTATKIVLNAYRELSPEEKRGVADAILKDAGLDMALEGLFKSARNRKKFDHAAMARDFLDNFNYKEPGSNSDRTPAQAAMIR